MSFTSIDLAKICGVSRATVDRALKGKSGISEKTREAILRAATEHGYSPNIMARNLSTGKSNTIGIVVFDLKNEHFSLLSSAIERYFSEQGILTFICISEKDKRHEREIIETLKARMVDGIVLLPVNHDPSFSDWLQKLDMPIVTVSNKLTNIPLISGDNVGAAMEGMQNLYDRGYRTIHFICPPLRYKGYDNIYAQQSRANGYTQFLSEHPDIHGTLIETADYMEWIAQSLKEKSEKPAFFFSSDHYLLKVRRYMLDNGMDLSSTAALMGFDGFDCLKQFTLRPSSIQYPASEIGTAAAKSLHRLINGEQIEEELLIPCPLLPGNIPD